MSGESDEAGTRVPTLAELLAEVPGLKVTFSPWCRTGLVGDENCICVRCLRRRGLVGDDTPPEHVAAFDALAENQAKLLDLARETGRALGMLQAQMATPPEVMREIAALSVAAQESVKSNDLSKIDNVPAWRSPLDPYASACNAQTQAPPQGYAQQPDPGAYAAHHAQAQDTYFDQHDPGDEDR